MSFVDPASLLLFLGRKGVRVWSVRRPFNSDDRAYQVGDRIDVDTLATWRNAPLLVKQGWILPALPDKDVVAKQRAAAGRKSRTAGQAFKTLVWRAMQRLAEPGVKNVRASLLNPEILKSLATQPPALPIATVREDADRPGGLVYVTKDGREGPVTGRSLSVYLVDLKKRPPAPPTKQPPR